MTYVFMVFGLLALLFNQGRKREFCAVYLFGLVLEEAADFLFVKFINRDWVNYYLIMATIDIFVMSLFLRVFHKSYVLVYPIFFIMFLANAMIVREADTTGSHFAYAVRLHILHPLNILILVLFFGADNGFKRIFNYIRSPRVSLGRAYYALGIWSGNPVQSTENVTAYKGAKACKTQ